MAVKTLNDLEKLQAQMREQFEPFLQALALDDEAPLMDQDPQTLIKDARASLEAAIRERDEGLRMADQRIERRRRELAALESTLTGATAQPDAAELKRKPKPRKAARKGR